MLQYIPFYTQIVLKLFQFMGFRIDAAVSILKTICGIEWDK